MRTGSLYGTKKAASIESRRTEFMSISRFLDDEGGYTSIAMALSLLVSVSLVFVLATAEWSQTRAADIQSVADVSACAAEHALAQYMSVARVLDACVLSTGLAGLTVYGAGLVMLCVPGAQDAGLKTIATSKDILDARARFALSAYEGLERFEKLLPIVAVAKAASTISANSKEQGITYTGAAVLLPLESSSVFPSNSLELTSNEMQSRAEKLAQASLRAEEATRNANDALLRGWLADCGAKPFSMYQRASTLTSLKADANPFYPSVDTWNFGVGLVRARNYYAARLAAETTLGSSIEALTDSCARRAFFEFSCDELSRSSYSESLDGHVVIDFSELPKNASEVRATRLFTDVVWPCSDENGVRTLHSTLSCPGARGPSRGLASLAELEAGAVGHCEICRMDVGDLGKTPAASTNIENGFEHWWRELVHASRDYMQAHNAQVDAEQEMKSLAEDAHSVLEEALELISVGRPRLKPPGWAGCVSVCGRGEATLVPSELTSAFLSAQTLPEGIAISAATLAPDPATADNNLLASFFDRLANSGVPGSASADALFELWGRLLMGYGSAYDQAGSVAQSFLDSVDGVFGASVSSWIKERIKDTLSGAGLEPVSMELLKPVLCSSHDVLTQAGYDHVAYAQRVVLALSPNSSVSENAKALGVLLANELDSTKLELGRIPIPGTDVEIPLEIDLADVVGAL